MRRTAGESVLQTDRRNAGTLASHRSTSESFQFDTIALSNATISKTNVTIANAEKSVISKLQLLRCFMLCIDSSKTIKPMVNVATKLIDGLMFMGVANTA